MSSIKELLTTARRNGRDFWLGFQWGVNEFIETARLLWRGLRSSFSSSRKNAPTSVELSGNMRTVGHAFVAGCKSGSHEFYTPLRVTWRFLHNGWGKAVSKLDAKYLNETVPPEPDYSKMSMREAVALGAKRGFSDYFALTGAIYRRIRRGRP